ncbi:hypothetical protein J3E68DRAFT_440428 [Trichoderma sp. SZMC 28012]
MVYRGKPSPACALCRKRKIKCDLQRPRCSQCRRAKETCTGYRDLIDVIFHDETNSTKSKALTRICRAQAEAHADNSFAINNAISLCFLPYNIDEQAKSYFVHSYVFIQEGTAGYLSGVARLLGRPGLNSALEAAMVAVGSAGMACKESSPLLELKARQSYGTAINYINEAIHNRTKIKEAGTLAAILVLGLYEMIMCDSQQSLNAWYNHMLGALAVAHIRGTQQFKDSEAGMELFLHLRSQIISTMPKALATQTLTQYDESLCDLHEASSAIFASVPFYLNFHQKDGTSAKPVNALILMWNLYAAARLTICAGPAREWAIQRLEFMGHSMGVRQATALASVLKKRAAWEAIDNKLNPECESIKARRARRIVGERGTSLSFSHALILDAVNSAMIPATASPSRDVNDDNDDDESTQPFSSPGRPFATEQFDDKDELTTDGNGSNNGNGISENHDGEESAEPVSGDPNGEVFEVDMICRNNLLTWQNADGQMQRVEGLNLDLYLDTSTNTAIFKIYGYVLLKGSKSKSSKQAVYLFIHPETIQSITLQTEHAAPFSTPIQSGPIRQSLCFSLTAQPHLVVPKNLILESRPKTKALLDSIQALATVTAFTVHLSNLDTATSTQENLELIVSTFSLSHDDNRPSTNTRRANLTTLYAGRGGEIVNVKNDVANTEACLPPYNKRKRDLSDHGTEYPSTTQDQILLILKNICTRLDSIEGRMVKLEDKVSEALDSTHSRGEEERLELLEEVENRIDDCITDMRIESQDIIEDLKDEVDATLERLDNEASERIERLENDIEENTTKVVEKCLKTKLTNASLRIDGSVFLDL